MTRAYPDGTIPIVNHSTMISGFTLFGISDSEQTGVCRILGRKDWRRKTNLSNCNCKEKAYVYAFTETGVQTECLKDEGAAFNQHLT